MTKRSFFKSLMGAVAAVALAPEIAFGVRLRLATFESFEPAHWQEVFEAFKRKNEQLEQWRKAHPFVNA